MVAVCIHSKEKNYDNSKCLRSTKCHNAIGTF